MARFVPKRTPSGHALLNLGCGWKMHRAWNNLDFSPYARLVRRPFLTSLLGKLGILGPERKARLEGVDPDIICWDLRRGIPFADATFDAVYHSHFLEHLDRDVAPVVLCECHRVLKPSGILRVVVPDWRWLTDRYLEAVAAVESGKPGGRAQHERAIADLIEQMVRKEAFGTRKSGLGGWIERRIRGGAADIGELHRWMYDRHSLTWLCEEAGFRLPRVETAAESRIPNWENYRLDLNEQGTIYKPESLFLEVGK